MTAPKRPDVEATDNLRRLLVAYTRHDEQPTENELWCGCKDAALALKSLLAYLAHLEAENERLRDYALYDARCPCCGQEDRCLDDCTFQEDSPSGHERQTAAREALA